MKTLTRPLLSALLAITLLTGCNQPASSSSNPALSALEGKSCYVIYRRDALGFATDETGISAETIWSGTSGELAAKGTLQEATDAWILLETEKGLVAIPSNSILSVHESK